MERLFASPEPLDAGVDRILACGERHPAPLEVWRHEKRLPARERPGGRS